MSSRASTLAIKLRSLKNEKKRVLDEKSEYDSDINRVLVEIYSRQSGSERDGKPSPVHASTDSPPPPNPHSNGEPLDGSSESNQKSDERIEQPGRPSAPDWAKRAYKQVALRTHPDRVGSMNDIDPKRAKELEGLYREASEAYKAGDFDSLLEVALGLGVTIDVPPEHAESSLESKIRKEREEIESLKKSLSWSWGISFGDIDKRVSILRQCSLCMEVPAPEESFLRDLVVRAESGIVLRETLGNVNLVDRIFR